MNNSRRPLSRRKTIQLLLILTILAWATQTLVHQWGFGQEVQPFVVTPDVVATTGGSEKFVPGDQNGPSGTLEIRGEATITGADVKLKQICHWSDDDAVTFGSIADLSLAKLSETKPFQAITVDQVRQTLRDAGVNVALINFSGATSCTVSRSDVQIDEKSALDQWIASNGSGKSDSTPHETPTASNAASQPAAAIIQLAPSPAPAPVPQQDKPVTLRDLLTNDVCQRLNVSPDLIQMSYNPEDDKVLALSEPYFKFSIKPNRMLNLGGVSWDLVIVSDSGASKKVSISALARAWQVQTIVARPLAYKELLQDSDFTSKKVLVDTLPEIPLLPPEQCIGQQAARDLKPGTIMTARLVDPVPLVHSGQLVTITVTQGTVQIKAVARAIEAGGLGESIKVRNETTRDIFQVTVTGPQEARLGAPPAGSGGVASAGN